MYKVLRVEKFAPHLALQELEENINKLDREGFKALGPAQLVKVNDGSLFCAYITMYKNA